MAALRLLLLLLEQFLSVGFPREKLVSATNCLEEWVVCFVTIVGNRVIVLVGSVFLCQGIQGFRSLMSTSLVVTLFVIGTVFALSPSPGLLFDLLLFLGEFSFQRPSLSQFQATHRIDVIPVVLLLFGIVEREFFDTNGTGSNLLLLLLLLLLSFRLLFPFLWRCSYQLVTMPAAERQLAIVVSRTMHLSVQPIARVAPP
mmetsp:Transcript_22141/g.61621  ORF Transcript_22141/g.61621 Transcript_22141/m.61621 type:complete len:200 (-) Transcript_22141:750-1349(-)